VVKVECLRGWATLYGPVLDRAGNEGVRISCIKEKFGQLHIYIDRRDRDGASDRLKEDIHKAYHLSALVCEECGAWGVMRLGARMQVLCGAHAMGRPTGWEYEVLDACCKNRRARG
jgi:hypothetical protein